MPRNPSQTTIVLAIEHQLVRDGLRALLEAQTDFRIVAECGEGFTAVRLLKRVRPHVLIVHFSLPGLSGVEVTREASRQAPDTHVVVLSPFAKEFYVTQALRHGAAGYVLTDAHAAHLVKAIRAVEAGHRYLSPSISRLAVEAYLEQTKHVRFDLYEALTAREREVLRLAADGLSSRAVAGQLSISPRTAETHRANLMRKLELHSPSDLFHYAMHRGILHSGE